MTRFGYAFGVAAALLGLAGMLQPAKATTIVYSLTGDTTDIGGPFDFSFTSAGFFVPPAVNEFLLVSNVTACFVAGGPCTETPVVFNDGPSPPEIDFSLENAAETGLTVGFAPADFGAVGTYQSVDHDGTITMTVTAAAPEPSTWAMLLIGFSGLGFAGYRKASAVRAVRADLM
jgi:hypothetical protein